MPATITPDALRPLLKAFDFGNLFTQRLGWERHQAAPLTVTDGNETYTLNAIAHKRGLVAYVCGPGPDGKVPAAAVRRRIDRAVGRTTVEHLIVFTDAARTRQVWQWV